MDTLLKLLLKNWILFLSIVIAIGFRVFAEDPTDRVVFLDIGQGDATLIQIDGQNIIIDGGPDDSVIFRMEQYLLPWDRTVDIMILTHPHNDHIQGLLDILERYDVKEIWVNAVCYKSEIWSNFLKDKRVMQVTGHEHVVMGHSTLEVLYPIISLSNQVSESGLVDKKKSKINLLTETRRTMVVTPNEIQQVGENKLNNNIMENDMSDYHSDALPNMSVCATNESGKRESFDGNVNNDSIVVQLSYLRSQDWLQSHKQVTDEFRIFFTGDAEKEIESLLLERDILDDVDVFQGGHHCSATSNIKAFLEKIQPELVVCSCGLNNKYGHPDKEVLDRFDDMGISYLRTDMDGDVVLDLE